ncbi:MAG: Transcription elongation factor GreB [SAR92 bacterium MED-G29]|jgi:transcription elongation factor GreB|nr:transcription elongation factor GreB [Porticoccaceae bacterium]CAI8282845.1 MAG: Transcription elongation factor GreB [SAR92 bacterium MED-G29]|tara:strand:+ start:607 stop:1104 length:498 start_codon:yes stop_codon:yes gene_type:complete
MGRYRPPGPKSSPYVTPEGASKMRAEVHQLWKIERPQVTQIVHEAAKNGDRSENGDYIYGKRRLREIDSRVRYLTKRIENATIVEDKPRDPSKVFFAAWVTVEDEDSGEEHVYRLVGSDEIDTALNWISIDSPIARALVGKSIDEEVNVKTPAGDRGLVITGIRY